MADENKPLPASAKKRKELRGKGSVVRSPDIVTTVVIGVTLFGLMYFGSRMGIGFAQFMEQCFQEAGKPAGQETVSGIIRPMLTGTPVMALMLFCAAVVLAAILANLVQTGPIIVPFQIEQGMSRLNPVNGVKTIFSLRRLVASGLAILKLIIIVAFAYAAVRELWNSPVFLGPVNVSQLGAFFQQAAWAVGWRILVALLILATVDYLYQRWQYEKDNKMSLQELKDEVRQSEGSNEVKSRQRGMMRKIRSLRRQLEDMTNATIVVTNPTHYAVALRYVRGENDAPVVLAKGVRRNAQAIKAEAARLGIPTMENVSLARGLYKHAEVGEVIPPLYFQAVAQILADLYRRGYRAMLAENEQRDGLK
ncbi:flagellar biosynthetic protein FlhB [Verrucomicrobium sp. GAS474]|uniref:EscU/YscU/HrcU family type III secretion system export apparatus switch protein n=1 Tax=Verrucomicrobium sp. GAS474 TaxID=1882831 RepID=UPI000879C233|nr:EscU/YscU/HrcU family type III secretion system export apparatus switch protein [Verrucomicrobium sp. GAS474]SDU24830.1 flagellar biosynthetic protein FlhB [Verrucomicrobium sp. GAS474]